MVGAQVFELGANESTCTPLVTLAHWTKNEISYTQEICRIGLNPLHISFIRTTFSPYPLLEMCRK